jgi:hypothetical protein
MISSELTRIQKKMNGYYPQIIEKGSIPPEFNENRACIVLQAFNPGVRYNP